MVFAAIVPSVHTSVPPVTGSGAHAAPVAAVAVNWLGRESLTTTCWALSGPFVGHGQRVAVGAALGRIRGAGLGDREVGRAEDRDASRSRVLLAGSGSGVGLDTLAELLTVTARRWCWRAALAVIVIVAVAFAASVPSEQETVVSQLPWLGSTATSVSEAGSSGSLTVTFWAEDGPEFCTLRV